MVREYLQNRRKELSKGYTQREAEQLAYQNFRTFAVGRMASSCVQHFVANYDELKQGTFPAALTEPAVQNPMKLSPLCESLQRLAQMQVYTNQDIVAIEFAGRRILHGLLDIFLEELGEWKAGKSKLMKSLLPPKVDDPDDEPTLSDDYRFFLQAADYVAGMTDSFARDLHHKLTGQR